MRRGVWRPIALFILACGLAGCRQEQPAQDRPAGHKADTQPAKARASASTAPAAPDEPRSILQPDVLAGKEAKPKLERSEIIISFADPGARLGEEARAQLDELLASPIVEAGGPIVLRGHTDSRGYDGDNLVVSRRRAEAVARYLEQGGVAPERLSIIALGEARPIAPNATPDGNDDPDGRARNRRVEIEILPPPE